jgi:hypothetical protein
MLARKPGFIVEGCFTKPKFRIAATFLLCVHGFKGSRFHPRPRTAFGMCIYEKSVIFVMPNPKFLPKLAIIWKFERF